MYMLLEWLLQPLSIVALFMLLTLLAWLVAGAKPLLPFLLFCITISIFLSLCMPFFANALVYRIENARKNPAYCDTIDNPPIVVLGGGIDQYVDTESPYETLNPDSLIRTLRAPEFANSSTHFYVMGGGGNGRMLGNSMKAVLVNTGINPDRITAENGSYSTYQNATALTKLLPPSDNKTILLITSMMHIYRASAVFEKAGYQVCHVGVDIQYAEATFPTNVTPYLSGLQKTTFALHEVTAVVLYKVRGYM